MHMRFLTLASHWVVFQTELFLHDISFDLLTPLDSTVFPMTQEIEKEKHKNFYVLWLLLYLLQ